jgi:hypothetical protein
MSLIITFMFEPAKLQMNCARANGSRTRRDTGTWVLVAPCCVTPTPRSALWVRRGARFASRGHPNQTALNVWYWTGSRVSWSPRPV